MSHKAPSEGQKVDLGQNAPTRNEAAGTVPSGSLADESNAQGGEFARNVGVHGSYDQSNTTSSSTASNTQTTSSNTSSSQQQGASYSQASGAVGGGGNRNLDDQRSYGGAAPSYVNNQYVSASGPHGKNITEGFQDDSNNVDGIQKAMNATPGSIDDPSRRAEHQMELNNNARSGASGPMNTELSNETKYDTLNADKSI